MVFRAIARVAVPFCVSAVLVLSSSSHLAARQSPVGVPDDALELWLCPNHKDQQGFGPAQCPIDGVAFEQRFVLGNYVCPMHAHVHGDSGESCPICHMSLAPTTLEIEWFCTAEPDLIFHEPGSCKDGSAMELKMVPMAHGDHNAKHGGILFMAPDGFHHLEGTLSVDGRFRLYLYNDFTRPIDAAPFRARVDSAADLDAVDGGAYLSADLDEPPGKQTEVVLFVRFPEDENDERRFDFIFPESMLVGKDGLSGSGDEVVGQPASAEALPEFFIPDEPLAIVEEILKRDRRIQNLIAKGLWPDLYIPALEAKELMLELRIRDADRSRVPAKRLIRAAWLLDVYGDMGNRLEVERSYQLFEKAIRELEKAYAR